MTEPNRESDRVGDELLSLANAYCDGLLTPVDAERLDELLRGSEPAQQRFLLLLDVHAALLTEARRGHLLPDSDVPQDPPHTAPPNGAKVNGSRNHNRINGHIKSVPARPLSSTAGWFTQTVERVRSKRFLAGVAAAAVIVVALIQIVNTLFPFGFGVANQPVVVVVEPLARVLRTLEADGKYESPLAAGQDLGKGDLQISTGRLEVAVGREVLLLAEGPSRLRLEDAHHARLISGRVTVRVLNPLLKFVVNAQGVKVTDLGTEFGVAIGKEGDVHIQVFEGNVLVESDGDSGKTMTPQRLTAGQAYSVSANSTAQLTRFDDSLFVRDFSPADVVNQLYSSPGACVSEPSSSPVPPAPTQPKP